MKKWILLALFCYGSTLLFAQTSTDSLPTRYNWAISTRLGVNSFNQANLSIEKRWKNNQALEATIGYNYGPKYFGDGFLTCSFLHLRRAAYLKGWIGRLGYIFYTEPNHTGNSWSIFIDYRRSAISGFYYSSTCAGGSSAGGSSSYNWEVADLGVMAYWDIRASRKENPSFYFGLGVNIRDQKIDYRQIEHSGGPVPISNPHSEKIGGLLRFDMGMKVYLARFR